MCYPDCVLTGRSGTRRGKISDLSQLRALQAVAHTGSISSAASALHITTSAVSQRLAKMEREVGQPLLRRKGRGVRLTDTALLLAGYADRIFTIVDEAEAALECHHGSLAGRVTVAAFSTAARGLLPHAVSTLNERHPDLQIEVSEMEPDECLAPLLRGEIDIAIVQDWFNLPLELSPGLVRTPLLDDIVDVALPAGHRLAGQPVVDFDELFGEAWVSWPAGTVCHNWLLHTFRREGVEPRVVHTAVEYATQFAFVAAGLGVAAAPRLGRHFAPPAVHIAALRPPPVRHVYAVAKREGARRLKIRTTLDALCIAAKSSTVA